MVWLRPMARCHLALLAIAAAVLAQGCDRAVAPPAQAASGRGSEAANSPIEHFTYTRVVHDLEPLGERLWAATPGGLVELDRGSGRPLKVHTTLDGLPDIQCSDLMAADGVLWIATRGGLVRLRPDTGDYRVVGEGAKERLEYQPERGVLWALGRQSATRVALRSGKARTWPLGKWQEACVADDEVWTVVRPQVPAEKLVPRYGGVTIQCFQPLSNRTRVFDPSSWVRGTENAGSIDRATLVPAGRSVWVYVPYNPGGSARRLIRIDRASGAAQPFGDLESRSSPVPRCPEALGGDVWAAWDECNEYGGQLPSGGELRHFDARSGTWRNCPGISGARRDAPTGIKQLDGELWVATRGYDEMRELITFWGMGTSKGEAPAVKHLALCRWQPAERTWEVHHIPAENDYSYVSDFWMTSTDFWLAVNRADPEESLHEGGLWLASYPRAGGELEWHCQLSVRYASLDPYAFRRLEGMYSIDDAVWLCHRERVAHFARATRRREDVEWPCALQQTGCRAVVARRNDVRVGTERCAILGLDATGQRLVIVGRVKISSSYVGLVHEETVREPDGTERTVHKAVGWGADVPSAVTSLGLGPDRELWVTSSRGAGSRPAYAEGAWGRLPDDRPMWFSPGGLLRLDGLEAMVPTTAPWTWAHRGEADPGGFGPPPKPGQSTMSAPNCGLPGEPGVACVLPEEDRLWVGTLSDGLYLLQAKQWQRLGPLEPQRVESRRSDFECRPDDLVLAIGRDGHALWVATQAHLYRLDTATHAWEMIGPEGFAPSAWQGQAAFDPSSNASRYPRNSFLIEIDGDLWMPGRMGGAEDGLYRLRAGAEVVECVTTDFVPNCAVADGDCLGIGTEEGLVRFDTRGGEPTRLTEESGLASSPVVAVALEGDTLWVVSPDSVTRLTRAEFESRAGSARAGEARPQPPP